MNMNEFIKNFASLLEITAEGTLKPDTKLRDLEEWSSIFSLSIIAMADSEYDVRLKGDDIRNSVTLEDLYKIIDSKRK
jgi:acyl carrier protein